jgi:hypothetical protein
LRNKRIDIEAVIDAATQSFLGQANEAINHQRIFLKAPLSCPTRLREVFMPPLGHEALTDDLRGP